jgi:hypothetical protein
MKVREILLSVFFIPIAVTVFSQTSNANTSFDIYMLYGLYGISDQATSVKPEWFIPNTSSLPLVIGDAGLTPFATMDFGTLPIQSAEFIFHSELLSGYILNSGESIGWKQHPDAFDPNPLRIPTYDLTNIALFEFNGDFIPGEGTGSLRFGFENAYVNVPITFRALTPPEPPAPFYRGYITGTFSSVPEPATLLLLALGGLILRRKR